MSLTLKDKEKIIKTLYERCSIGEISVMQRELLLKKLNDETAPEFKPITEACENSIETRRKKFNIISTKLYKECANGKISLEQREILLERARGEYLTEGVVPKSSDDIVIEGVVNDTFDDLKSRINATQDKLKKINEINKKASDIKKSMKTDKNKTHVINGLPSIDALQNLSEKYINIINSIYNDALAHNNFNVVEYKNKVDGMLQKYIDEREELYKSSKGEIRISDISKIANYTNKTQSVIDKQISIIDKADKKLQGKTDFEKIVKYKITVYKKLLSYRVRDNEKCVDIIYSHFVKSPNDTEE